MNTTPPSPLKEKVFKRISSEHVSPRSRLWFQSRECVVWTLWLLSVAVGSVAVAVVLFVLNTRWYAFYEATHDSFLEFLIETAPIVWALTFVLLVAAAVYNFRHTAHGYRYPLWKTFSSSVTISVVGGCVLYILNVGFLIDHEFGEYMPQYISQAKQEYKMWQMPNEGRLIGKVVSPPQSALANIMFIDVEGVTWEVMTDELSAIDWERIMSGERVRLLGIPPTASERQIHACGVFPWMMDKPVPQSELAAERTVFKQIMSEHIKRQLEADTNSTLDQAQPLVEVNVFNSTVTCAKLRALEQMEKP